MEITEGQSLKNIKIQDTSMSKLRKKLKHGLFMYGVSNRAARLGLEFTPFYWEKEFVTKCDAPKIRANVEEYSIRSLNEEDLRSLHSSGDAYRISEKIQQLKDGQICLGLLHKEKIAAYSWLEYKSLNFRNLEVVLKKNESYLGGMHTIESYRGKNLAAYLRYRIYRILEENGRDTIYSISDYFNGPAVRFKEKLNSKHVKLHLYINLFDKIQRRIILRSYTD